jgi:hypothetical protein
MTDSIKWTTLTAAIAAQTVAITDVNGNSVNLTIYSEANFPPGLTQEMCPALAPTPDNFVTGVHVTRDSLGADAAYKSIQYTLHYNFFFAPAQQGITLFAGYGAMVTAASAILLYFTTHTALSGATDLLPQDIPHFGAMKDGAGALFHGCEIAFDVTQYLEA